MALLRPAWQFTTTGAANLVPCSEDDDDDAGGDDDDDDDDDNDDDYDDDNDDLHRCHHQVKVSRVGGAGVTDGHPVQREVSQTRHTVRQNTEHWAEYWAIWLHHTGPNGCMSVANEKSQKLFGRQI